MKIRNVLLFFSSLILSSASISAQENYTIKGHVSDIKSEESLIGVHVVVKDNVYGTITGSDGDFDLTTKLKPPFYIDISYMGFETQEVYVSDVDTFLDIKLKEQYLLGQEVVVSSSRIEESILQAPVSVEKMNARDLKQVSAANFYDGLYQLKGVDMNVHGLTFRLPNTRGFNDYTNYRMNQIIDGMENVAPGLSFSAGNIFGLSPIDVESVEMVVGASSALYGPGGVNGTLVMKSKGPFLYQGLSVSLQSGIMNIAESTLDHPTPMYDVNIRYAKAFSNRMAVKVTGSILNATDWQASDVRDRSDLNNPGLNRLTNPGYDGVNVYGDETLVSLNLKDVGPQVINGIAESQGIQSGTPEYDELYNRAIPYFPDQLVTRTGWLEKDLAEDKTKNLRIGGSLHYFITERTESIIQANYAQGTSVYTAQNRFAAREFYILSGKIEINNPNYYVRAWSVSDNAGSSYDIGGTALLMNEGWKPSETWFQDYLAAYTQTTLVGGNMNEAHKFARLVADNRDPVTGKIFDNSKPAIPESSSPEFNSLFEKITSTPLNEGGGQVFDQSKIFQVEGMYDFTDIIQFMEMQVGMSHRWYVVNSNGTIFADEPGDPIIINEFGTFIQINKNLLNDYLRLTGTFRYDKNENFEAQYTPRFSVILFLDDKKEHSFRGTYQTAYRFPSISDQWVDLYTGVFRTVGGMPQVQEKYNFNTIPLYPMSGRNPITDKPVTENGPITLPGLRPEKVTSTEIGYKGLFLGKKLFLDTYIYYNKYKGFEASWLLAQLAEDAGTENDLLYNTFFTTDEPVSSYGWAVGLDYMTQIGILIRGNVAKNKLIEGIEIPGVESRFNTPEYRTNISLGHFAILPNLGFNVNVHWQSKFTWESSFGKGEIPAFTTLDAQISYKVPLIKTTFKLGGSNILNNYYTTSFGSAQIGGLYYISLIYEDILGYLEKER
ncbi:TonB-dependent receptor [Maribellus mangrovi]|uniref:TonB-dependent receptor n=1 Tax=Maribellus mangrovi TaxID=3133146 RepID=UPI0030EDAD0D